MPTAATTQRNRGLRVQVEVTNCLRIRLASTTDPSVEQGIDVAGIGFDRQLRKPARHLVDSLPLLADEDQALTQRRTIAAVAERGATLETGARHIALDRREFEREAVGRPRESGQRLRLETLDVDLDESRHPVPRDQGVKSRKRHHDRFGPALPLPARRTARRTYEIVRGR